jgi:hypothetical protein
MQRQGTRRSAGFISVGATCQQAGCCFLETGETVVRIVLSLKCLAKRKQALRGRNLPRDSQVEGAPTVHRASGVNDTPGAVFLPPVGHPSHASENPAVESGQSLGLMSTVPFACIDLLKVRTLRALGGIGIAVLHCKSGAVRRCDSSLRSHRTWRSLCRHVSSGLNKTMFASVGPNSRCRGHQLAGQARPWHTRCHLGRIKPCRGHRRDGMPTLGIAKIPLHIVRFSEGLSRLLSWLSRAFRLVGH